MGVSQLPFRCLTGSLMLAAIACSSQESRSPDPPSPTFLATPSATRPMEGSDASNAVDSFSSLRNLVEWCRIAVVGTAVEIVGEESGHTFYSVAVEEVIVGGDVITDTTIPVFVEGLKQPNGLYPLPLQDPPKIGARYLFLLLDGRPIHYGGFGSPPNTKWELSEDGFLLPNDAESAPAIRAISGITEEQYMAAMASDSPEEALAALKRQSVEAAAAAIKAALAEGPVPPYPSWWNIDSSEPTPTLWPVAAPKPTTTSPPTPAVTPDSTPTPPPATPSPPTQ